MIELLFSDVLFARNNNFCIINVGYYLGYLLK